MIYLLIFIFIVFCVYFYDIRENNVGKTTSYYFIFLAFVLLSTLRYRVGGDALFYEDMYEYLPDLSGYFLYMEHDNYLNYQPFWILFQAICKSITTEYVFFQFVHSVVFNLSLFYFIKRYTSKPFTYLAILFVSLLYFYFSFEIQRETLAIAVFLFNIKNLEEKRWIPYFLLSLVSFMFHISAIILFVLPLFRYLKFNMTFLYIVLAGSVVVFIFRSVILNFIFSLLFMDVMRERMDIYSEIEFSALGFLAYYIVRVFLLLPIMIYNIKNNLHENRFKWFYAAFIIASVMAQFFVGFERLLNYMFPIYILIIIDFFYKQYPLIESKLVRTLIALSIILHVFFIWDYKLFTKNDWGQRYSSLFFPYTTVFNPTITQEREEFYENLW